MDILCVRWFICEAVRIYVYILNLIYILKPYSLLMKNLNLLFIFFLSIHSIKSQHINKHMDDYVL
ncbi:hypothetical protein HanRHA438_Chr17g0790671 [Helianthus annuus]|nr:hypothetical protein HanRHA438_Chr17g0790671 [Helianthus annuus]